jgi:hypothetical protein
VCGRPWKRTVGLPARLRSSFRRECFSTRAQDRRAKFDLRSQPPSVSQVGVPRFDVVLRQLRKEHPPQVRNDGQTAVLLVAVIRRVAHRRLLHVFQPSREVSCHGQALGVGPVVNLAARLEALTRQFNVGAIVDEETTKEMNAAQSRPGW